MNRFLSIGMAAGILVGCIWNTAPARASSDADMLQCHDHFVNTTADPTADPQWPIPLAITDGGCFRPFPCCPWYPFLCTDVTKGRSVAACIGIRYKDLCIGVHV